MTEPNSGQLYRSTFNLFEFMFASPLRLTNGDMTVVWSGNEYTPAPVSISEVPMSVKGVQDSVTVGMQNVDRAIAAIILNEDVQGDTAKIYRTGWASVNSYSTPVLVFEGQMDSISVREGIDSAEVAVDIKSEFVRWHYSIPKCLFSGTCNWIFASSPGCQYTGAASMCNKTYERCSQLSNTARFRGFRHLPTLEEKDIWWGKVPPAGAV